MLTLALAVQAPLVTVQVNVLEAPTVSPVTPEVGLFVVVTVPVPDDTVHSPVPGAGLLPAKVVEVTLHKA
jgi:hypothetical protein